MQWRGMRLACSKMVDREVAEVYEWTKGSVLPRTNTRQGMRICNRPSIEFAPLFSSAEGRISRSSLYILHLLAANYLPSTVEHLFHLLTGSDQCNFLYCYIAISSYNHSFLLLPTFRSFSNTRWSILRFVLVDTSFSWILSRSFL